ncbi:MAG: 2Fe-2S iron-sulfur cluster binding domain-containing protein [Rhodospirillales bacterium]|nr:2Fe-2S iron-sulfur cluster binding domain-containing protein [Alphaproteobacteria bacterium]MCB9981736.1 2Fe-2S iron-sulfur cluster binding domain-containing protein [Rhodospirillales bacterium]
MPQITFLHKDGSAQTVQAEDNWSIMQIAVEHKIKGIEGACGGSMACATCHVYIHPDWIKRVNAADNEQCEEEEDMLDMAFDVRENSRLGCQVKLTEDLDGLIVALPGTKNWE